MLVSPALRSWWGLKQTNCPFGVAYRPCITGSSELVGIETNTFSNTCDTYWVSPALRSWWGLKLYSVRPANVRELVSPALRSWWGLKHRICHIHCLCRVCITGSSELV